MAIYYDFQIREILDQLKSQPSESLESETVEFKGYRDERALHNSKDLAEELSAFANFQGGIIIIGVRDSSDVPYGQWSQQLQGIPDVDIIATKERLAGKLKPNVELSVNRLLYEGKQYVFVQIRKSIESLVSTSGGKTCIRDGRSSRPMFPEEIERAVKALSKYDWSGDPLPEGTDAQLDPKAVSEAMEDFNRIRGTVGGVDQSAYLEAIGATHNGQLTRGGLLFLGEPESIRNILGDFEFRFTWKKSNGKLAINDVWSDNLWTSIKRAKAHFDKCNSTERFRSGEKEFDAPLMDMVAFHEAYLNALVHRDYSVDGMISVTYSGKELRIHSPGTFFGGITPENIALHEPRHRNKNLARMLMTHHLVDRAGMGVLRMGLGSLMYGRAFPEFREQSDAIEVKMEAEYLRPGIAVLALDNTDWGIPELLVLNAVYETGVVTVQELERRLTRLVENPWDAVKQAVGRLKQVELCGTRDGVFVRVLPSWKTFLNVGRVFRTSPSSSNYVKLYEYLRTHGQASNADLSELLGYSHSSQTSKFLREAKYVGRVGSGPSARWQVVNRSEH